MITIRIHYIGIKLKARPLCIFSNDPYHAGPRLGLVQGVEVLTERGDDALVLVWILPEYVLDDNHGLLQHSQYYLLPSEALTNALPGRRS